MKTLKALTVLLMLGQLFAQDAQPKPLKPTVRECRANLKQWIPLFRDAYGTRECDGDGTHACPFAAGLRALSTDELLDIPPLAQACIFADRHRKGYAWVAVRAENVIVMRAGYFFQDTDQMDTYIRWEDRQRGIAPKDEPDTVAKRQR